MPELTQNGRSALDAVQPQAYREIRRATLALCATLEPDDYGLQAMPEVSPPRWHLAHTTWFFETFLLVPFARGYRHYHPSYEYLFNSYYHGVGRQYPRAQRSLLSRPTVREVLDYRASVDAAMEALLEQADHPQRETILARCELGMHHEQQHQELLCTDLKYCFSFNPLYPALGRPAAAAPAAAGDRGLAFAAFAERDVCIGHRADGFHFDNEAPAHRFHLPAFRLARRLVTNAEYLAFVEEGGYAAPALWLADGWLWKEAQRAIAPRYWIRQDDGWFEYTLYGLQPLDPDLPVSHVNYYEADACARWFGLRLPTEQEWEAACRELQPVPGTAAIALHPGGSGADGALQLFGSLWQWTRSAYAPYPGYRPAAGAIGEYNGKFMCNQLVLRGSSCVTPPGHARFSYRNFFYPADQWQFTGIRLADDP